MHCPPSLIFYVKPCDGEVINVMHKDHVIYFYMRKIRACSTVIFLCYPIMHASVYYGVSDTCDTNVSLFSFCLYAKLFIIVILIAEDVVKAACCLLQICVVKNYLYITWEEYCGIYDPFKGTCTLVCMRYYDFISTCIFLPYLQRSVLIRCRFCQYIKDSLGYKNFSCLLFFSVLLCFVR